MAVICPTVTAFDPHEYRQQIERLQPFAKRVHIDLMDGDFAPTQSPPLEQIWWPRELTADIHLMYQRPAGYLEQLIKLRPHLVVIHYEAQTDHADLAAKLHDVGIKAGLAILGDTPVEKAYPLLIGFDHVLVFSGNLGYHGGEADLGLLDKVRKIREHYPEIEISWDGGINDQNAKQLVEAGVDVLNVGGFIQNAAQPQEAYQKLLGVVD
jgi:ribulose-phosphate 3-epimerase